MIIDPISIFQQSFLMNIRSGNIIIDSICSYFFVSLLSKLYDYDIYNSLSNINFFRNTTNQINFNCSEISTIYSKGGKIKMNGSDAFKAIMIDIKDNITQNKVKNLFKLKEFCCEKDDYNWDFEEQKKTIDESIKDIIFLVDQHSSFQLNTEIAEGLDFKITKSNEDPIEVDKHKTGKYVLYNLSISSKTKSLDFIQNYVNNVLDKYISKMNEKVNNNQFVFVYNGNNKDNEIIFTTYPFHTTCNIDKIYLHEKENIMKQIDFFKDNKEWYEKRGKPYTLGICSYGPPGCGKTSFEKSLAKYLNRHLIIVDLSKINSQNDADQIFFSEKINGKNIPYDKRIYIFPDIDAMNSLVSRDKTNKQKKMNELDIDKLLSNFKDKNKIDEDVLNLIEICDKQIPRNNDLNLSKLLNIFDGIPERTGQIIIFCTNHPEKLDPAILRPGRIDCLISFDKINVDNIILMLTDFFHDYKDYINSNMIDIRTKLLKCDKFWTPAEIFQICSKIDNIDKVIDNLSECKKNLNIM